MFRYSEHFEENRNIKLATSNINLDENKSDSKKITYQVPFLALNEVFIGESLSARYLMII